MDRCVAKAVANLWEHILKGTLEHLWQQLWEGSRISLANEGEKLLGRGHNEKEGISTTTRQGEIEHWVL
jgi:hypothetical protein